MKQEPVRTFEDLVVGQKSHAFILRFYRLTECFPKTELFGLTSQLGRAAGAAATVLSSTILASGS